MSNRIVRAFIVSGFFGFFNVIGSTQGGGDGFFNDKNQNPVGFNLTTFLVTLIFGWLIGFLPWERLKARLTKKR